MADKQKLRKYPQNMPWTDRILISLHSLLRGCTRRPDGTLNRCLLSFFEPRVAANPNPVNGVRTFDFIVDASRDLSVRVFSPSKDSNSNAIDKSGGNPVPVIVYFHGGGFSFFSASSRPYDTLCRSICHSINAVVISVSYRLTPEHKCPAQYDDGIDVLRFLESSQIGSDGVMPDLESLDFANCFLAGDSAGGNIIHHVARRWASSPKDWKKPAFGGEERTESEIQLEGAPVLSIATMDRAWKAFLPEDADRNHEAVNVFDSIKTGIEEAFPPTLLIIGGYDQLQDWQGRYNKALKEKEKQVKLVEYPDAIHGFYLFSNYEETRKLLEEMKDFVNENRSIIEKF